MVFPLYDDNTDRHSTPFVNYAIIALNLVTACSCPARCATSSSGQGSNSTTAALTSSRACPANGGFSRSLLHKRGFHLD